MMIGVDNIMMQKLIVAAGSDHAGFLLKNTLLDSLKAKGVQTIDMGVFTEETSDYPVIAKLVCEEVQSLKAQRGILVCGSGIGMSIAANRFSGIRCALCHDYYTAQISRLHNDANVIAMGQRTTGIEIAKQMIEVFLSTPFDTKYQNRVNQLTNIKNIQQ